MWCFPLQTLNTSLCFGKANLSSEMFCPFLLRLRASKRNPFYRLHHHLQKAGNHLHTVSDLDHERNLDPLVLIENLGEVDGGSGKPLRLNYPGIFLSSPGLGTEVLNLLV